MSDEIRHRLRRLSGDLRDLYPPSPPSPPISSGDWISHVTNLVFGRLSAREPHDDRLYAYVFDWCRNRRPNAALNDLIESYFATEPSTPASDDAITTMRMVAAMVLQ